MLDSETALYGMAGDSSQGEPSMYRLWAPIDDSGAKLIVKEHGHTAGGGGGRDEYNLRERVIRKGELMVDIGSNLGAVSIRVASKSEFGGHILMVEASPMTYIYQQINLHCNLPPSRMAEPSTPAAAGEATPSVISVFGAMSDKDGGTLTFTWDPKQTHTTRTWNDGRDQSSAAAAVREITVPTLSFNHLIEEYHLNLDEEAGSAAGSAAGGAAVQSIPFFKIDCEGCEYSVIPSFTDEQWDKIIEAHGELHAHAMTGAHKPSKAVIDITHTRYCHKLKYPPPWCKAEGWL